MISFRKIFIAGVAVAVLAAAVPAIAEPASSVDTDFDGIPDQWEREGRGPLLPSMVSVGRRDIIMYVNRRHDVSAEYARAEMERVTTFYRNLPITNPDGSTGIFMHVIEGHQIPPEDWGTSYLSLYEGYMPVEWRGIARGYIIGSGGGGQTVSADWGTSGGPWQAIAHEIGHMLKLDHTPPNQTAQGVSPLWTSIMNYMYTYSLNGEPDSVRFSQGQFTDLTLNETRLSEHINRPRAELSFLERAPNNFRLETLSATVTGVDWNRNGQTDNRTVRADINDGYSVVGKVPALTPGEASAGLSMSTIGDRVYLVSPRLYRAHSRAPISSPAQWRTSSIQGTIGAALKLHIYDGTAFSSGTTLVRSGVFSDVSSTVFSGMLAVAYVGPMHRPYVGLWEVGPSTGPPVVGVRKMLDVDATESTNQAIVVAGRILGSLHSGGPRPCPSPRPFDCIPIGSGSSSGRNALWVLSWSNDTKKVRIAEVMASAGASGGTTYDLADRSFTDLPGSAGSLLSYGPIGAAFDPLDNRLRIATYSDRGATRNALMIVELRQVDGGWSFANERFVGGSTSVSLGNSAPVMVLDPSTPISGRSQINIYARSFAPVDAVVPVIKYREIADRTQNDGWRIRIMVDEWNTTQSPPAVARYRNTDLFALRWTFNDRFPNRIVFYTQTGILDEDIRDHNDVTFIANRGLQDGLRGLRCWYQDVLRYNYELAPSECPSRP